jgi:hypothetical protein
MKRKSLDDKLMSVFVCAMLALFVGLGVDIWQGSLWGDGSGVQAAAPDAAPVLLASR